MAEAVLTPRNKTSNPELEPRLHRSQGKAIKTSRKTQRGKIRAANLRPNENKLSHGRQEQASNAVEGK
jgi:hypothetical protein